MKNNNDDFVTMLQGKQLRDFAQKLITSKYRIEQQSLNRYRVYEGPGDGYTLINRRTFVLLDKELYRIQSRNNPLAAGIEKALDNNALEFCISKASIDAMPIKLLAKTFAYSKVVLENVLLKLDNYIIKFSVVEAVSERELTDKEKAIAAMFQRANTNAVNPKTEKPVLPVLPGPETIADAVDTTAKEIPAK